MCSSFETGGQITCRVKCGELALDLGDLHLQRPAQQLDIVTLDNGAVTHRRLGWGLKTGWSKRLLINARLESISQKPTFADAFAWRRCVIPVTAWHEWQEEGRSRPGTPKVKYRFSYPHRQHLLMAGIWFPPGELQPDGAVVTLTCAPSAKAAQFHDRMPLFVRSIDEYLHEGFNPAKAVSALHQADPRLVIETVEPRGALF